MNGTAGVFVRLVGRRENWFGCWERAEVSVVLQSMRGERTTPGMDGMLAYQRYQRLDPHSLYLERIERSHWEDV